MDKWSQGGKKLLELEGKKRAEKQGLLGKQLLKNLGDKERKEKCVCPRAGSEWTEIKHVQTAVSHFPLSVVLSAYGSL